MPKSVQRLVLLRQKRKFLKFDFSANFCSAQIIPIFYLIFMLSGAGLIGCGFYKNDHKASNLIKSVDDLNKPNITLGAPMGARSDNVLAERFDKARLKRFSSVADGILAVKTGKIDAFGFDRSVLDYAVAKNSDLTLFPDFKEYGPLVIGSALQNNELIAQVNEYIAQYRADGTYNDMERRWIRGESSVMPDIPKPEQPDGTLIVGSEGKCEPMNYIGADGQMIGFDIELAQRLALFLNKKLEIVSPTWDGLILGTTNGKIDLLIANLNRTKDREDSLSFSDEYVQSEIVLLVRKNRLDNINNEKSKDEKRETFANETSDSKTSGLEDSNVTNRDFENLNGKNVEGICQLDQMIPDSFVIRPKKEAFDAMMSHARIALTVGSILEGIARKEYPESNILPFDTYPDLVPALQNDRADLAYSSYSSMFVFIQNNKGLFRCVEGPDQFDYVGIAFRQESIEANESVNSRLIEYEKNGLLKEIGKKWFVASDRYPQRYQQKTSPNAPVWNIAVSPDREPMIFIRDGEVDGFDAELIRRIGDDLGIRIEFSQMKFASLIPALLSGKSDAVVSSLSITPERQKKVLFSRPYLRNSYLALARQDFANRFFPQQNAENNKPVGEFSSLDELAGQEVAVLTGSMFDKVLLDRIPKAIPRYYPDVVSMISSTETGKTAAFLVDSPLLRLIMKQHKNLIGIEERLTDYDFGYVLPKSETALAAELSEFILARRTDGTIKKLEKKWGEGEEAEKIMPSYKNDGSKRTIHFGYLTEHEPFCYRKDNEPYGLEVELVRMFAESQGYALEFIPMTTDSLLPSTAVGKAQIGCGCITITDERKKSLLFSEPYHCGGANAIVRIKQTSQTAENEEQMLGFFQKLKASFHRTLILENRWKMVLAGLKMTLILTGLSALFGTLLAFPLCAMRRAKPKLIAGLAATIIYLVRGTPIVVFLLILYYIVFGSVDVRAEIIAIVGFSINFAAYFSEMLRSSISAIDRGEIEAAKALGFSRWGVFRILVLPQAIRYVMPMYKGEIIALLKMTAIVGYIAVEDLTKASDIIRSRTYEAFFPLILTTIIYLVVAWILIQLLSLIEFRVDPRFRSRIPKGVTKR